MLNAELIGLRSPQIAFRRVLKTAAPIRYADAGVPCFGEGRGARNPA